MRKLAVLLLVVWGCRETDIRTVDPEGLSAVERAKLITDLWNRCKEGVDRFRQIEPKSDHERRIKVLEEANSYGERAFKIAPFTAHQAAKWHARCLTFLGWEYDLWGQRLLLEAEQSGDAAKRAKGQALRKKASTYLALAVQRLTHYDRVYGLRNPDDEIYHLLEINYELLGDNRSAYLVSLKWLAELKSRKRGGIGDAVVLDQEIRRWTRVAEKLRQKLIEDMQPVPEDPYGALGPS
jgi:hypothetical protein